MADTLKRIESFAFDSKADGYDDDGYPVYDRAVGASVLRDAFKQFFSDGIFGTPADALMVSKGTGLSVSLAAGTFIINGAIATVQEPLSLKLADSAPKGRTPYGIMLRYDENSTYRSCYIRVATGTPSSSPVAPEPETGTAGVKEYRIGWVDVPSGATDLSKATVYDERGAACPYAAPFESIDLDAFFADLQTKGDETFQSFMAFLDANYELVESALDGTTAGKLQNEINELKITLPNTTFWDYVSGDTSSDQGDKHATVENIRYFRQKNKVEFLSDSEYISDVVAFSPTHPEFAVSVSNESALFNRSPSLSNYKWSDLAALSATLTTSNKVEYYERYKAFVGKTVSVPITGYGTFEFEVVGVCHDVDASGKPLLLSFMPSRNMITTHAMNSSSTTSGGWAASRMRSWLASTILTALPSDLQEAITAAHKVNTSGYGAATDDKLWLASFTEVGLGSSSSSSPAEGVVYERFASAANADRIRYSGSSAGRWWLRSVNDSSYFRVVDSDGSLSVGNASLARGVVPGFCI